jgi:hypothetical protein
MTTLHERTRVSAAAVTRDVRECGKQTRWRRTGLVADASPGERVHGGMGPSHRQSPYASPPPPPLPLPSPIPRSEAPQTTTLPRSRSTQRSATVFGGRDDARADARLQGVPAGPVGALSPPGRAPRPTASGRMSPAPPAPPRTRPSQSPSRSRASASRASSPPPPSTACGAWSR